MTETPDVLRERMVKGLWERGALTSSEVEAAFRKVPRHLFVPEVSPEEVYGAPEAVFTKHNERGEAGQFGLGAVVACPDAGSGPIESRHERAGDRLRRVQRRAAG